MAKDTVTIGFIGQGFIGKSYADDLERRGFKVVRYALEEPYRKNKGAVGKCDVVFIAVPTPTTPKGFDYAVVKGALSLVGAGKTAVIKSTLLPGTTRVLQKKFPRLFAMHSPEFLVARNAVRDASRPSRNIVGIPKNTPAARVRARRVLKLLPKAPFELVCGAEEAELIKYGGNLFLFLRVLFGNLIFDAARATGAHYETIRAGLAADPRIGSSHLQILHDSGHRGAKKGRGAGGLCFIKDIEALTDFYRRATKDRKGTAFLRAGIHKNIELLLSTGKDLDLLAGVYGPRVLGRRRPKRSKV